MYCVLRIHVILVKFLEALEAVEWDSTCAHLEARLKVQVQVYYFYTVYTVYGYLYLAPSSAPAPGGRKFINCPLKIVKYGHKANLSSKRCSDFAELIEN